MLGAQREDVEAARLVPDIDLPQLDFTNTARDVLAAGVPFPTIDDALRDKWINSFVRAGAIASRPGNLTRSSRSFPSQSDSAS